MNNGITSISRGILQNTKSSHDNKSKADVVIDVWESADGVNWAYHDNTNMPYTDTSADRHTQGKIAAMSGDGLAVDYDDYYIDRTRKYTSPEPSWGAFGSEETPVVAYMRPMKYW